MTTLKNVLSKSNSPRFKRKPGPPIPESKHEGKKGSFKNAFKDEATTELIMEIIVWIMVICIFFFSI